MTIPPDEPWRDSLKGELPTGQKMFPRVLDSYRPLKIHSEFHRLVLEWESALIEFMGMSEAHDGARRVEDGYTALQQRKKELYEWTRDNTPIPTPLYTIHMKF